MTYSTTTSLEDAVLDIRRRYGDGAIMRLGDRPARVDAISTGSPALDIALGVGGISRGRVEAIKEGGEVIGSRVRATVKKSKVAPPYKVAEFDIMHDAGISKAGDLVDLGVDWELIEARHGVYSYQGATLGRGKGEAVRVLRGDPALAGEIEKRVRQAAGVPPLDGPTSLPMLAVASAGPLGVR